MHYFSWNIGDYAIATRHLSDMEDLAYRRMIEVYYDKEQCLPLDHSKVARLIRLSNCKEEVETVLTEFFSETDKGYIHARIEGDITKYHDKAEVARKNGKLGGRPTKKAPAPKAPKEQDTSQIMAQMPLSGGKMFDLRESQTSKWNALYPSVDLGAEVNKMIGWLDANPTKRKTKAGIIKFMNTWLARVQDKGGSGQQQQQEAPRRTAIETNQFVDELEDQFQRSQAAKQRRAARSNKL